MAGGTSQLRGLDIRLREATGVPVNVAEDPTTCVVRGSGKVLDESIDMLKKIVVGGDKDR
jgi:rod shape-determining protein MreB